MKIDRLKQNEWFALTMGCKLYHLGNCGDYDCADEIAQDTIPHESLFILIDGDTAQEWINTLQEGLDHANI